MKELFLIRHAKAESQITVNDMNRNLSETGKKEASLIGEFLKINFFSPQIISSPAKRAMETAVIISEKINLPKESISYDNILYNIDPESLIKYISQISDKLNSVAIIGHNPTFEETLSIFLNHSCISMPTGAIALLSSGSNSWCDFRKKSQLDFFIHPGLVKNLF